MQAIPLARTPCGRFPGSLTGRTALGAAFSGVLLLALALAAPLAQAQKDKRGERPTGVGVDINGEMTFFDDYLYRGVSYSDGKVAVQGRMAADFSSGVDFGAEVAITSVAHAQAEVQLRGYLEVPMGLGVKFLSNIAQYRYQSITCPSDSNLNEVNCREGFDLDYEELGLGLGFRISLADFTWMYYRPYNSERDRGYTEVNAHIRLLGLYGNLGRYSDGASFLQIGARRQFGKVVLDVSYLADIQDPNESDILSAFREIDFPSASSNWYAAISMRF